MAAAFQSMEQTGISGAQATAIRNTIFELVTRAITDAGNEAAVNLAQQQQSSTANIIVVRPSSKLMSCYPTSGMCQFE